MYCKVSVPSECLVRKQKSHSAFGLLFVQSHRPRADEGSRSILALCTQQRKIGRVDRQQEHELSTTTDEVRIEQGKARAAIFAAATVLPNISSVSGHGIEVRFVPNPRREVHFFRRDMAHLVRRCRFLRFLDHDHGCAEDRQPGQRPSVRHTDRGVLGQIILPSGSDTGNSNPWLNDNISGCINGAQPSLINLPGNPT